MENEFNKNIHKNDLELMLEQNRQEAIEKIKLLELLREENKVTREEQESLIQKIKSQREEQESLTQKLAQQEHTIYKQEFKIENTHDNEYKSDDQKNLGDHNEINYMDDID